MSLDRSPSAMQGKRIGLILLGLLVGLCLNVTSLRMRPRPSAASTKRCVSIQQGGPLDMFAFCTSAGYDSTLAFPEHVPVERLAAAINSLLGIFRNCSQNGVAEAIFCSMIAPKCVSSSPNVLLPCRRVCSEFIKQCGVTMEKTYFDVIVGMCETLPDKNASSGQCLEPPGFQINENIPDPLLKPCEPVIIPACQGKGYTHTLLKISRQKHFYRLIYRTNYTKENASKEFPPREELKLQNHPKCRTNLERFICSTRVPPCFPPEGAAWYTLCKDACEEILEDCPGVVRDQMWFGCRGLAEEIQEEGSAYCKHTRWPDARRWGALMRKPTPTGKPSPAESGPGAGVIAAAVLVPALLAGVAIGAAFVWRKRASRWPDVRYSKQQDDMVPLET